MTKKVAMLLICGLPILNAQKHSEVERQGEGDLLLVKTQLSISTMILLPPGEELSEVICGDSDYWVIQGKDNAIFIKPAKVGSRTNINVITKSKEIYSFMVQEITKPGSKEKPDIRIMLGGDEASKLRKDKANLEELLARQDAALAEAADKDAELPVKKKEMILPHLWQMSRKLRLHL